MGMIPGSIGAMVEEVAERFAQAGLVFGHGTADSWDEAVALVLGVTGVDDDRVHESELLTSAQRASIEALAGRRIRNREPLPYLLGKIHYAGYDFFCEKGVVIPRSPIAQLIAERFRPWLRSEPETIFDVCCGTGCLGILCAHAFPQANVVLLDIDPRALELARRNVAAHHLDGRVEVVAADLLSAVNHETIDLLVSNPPYVDAVDFDSLPAEYRHEPARGLAGGEDGLDIVARLMDQAAACIATDGLFVCEVGASAAALQRRYPRGPFVWPDLPAGGEGVFVLEGRDLRDAAAFGQRA
jgi:ribosomal protein L3 glutamine methyltransferase